SALLPVENDTLVKPFCDGMLFADLRMTQIKTCEAFDVCLEVPRNPHTPLHSSSYRLK
ncbi:unnamed protein product, partial [Dicrocoelium dendriticum]